MPPRSEAHAMAKKSQPRSGVCMDQMRARSALARSLCSFFRFLMASFCSFSRALAAAFSSLVKSTPGGFIAMASRPSTELKTSAAGAEATSASGAEPLALEVRPEPAPDAKVVMARERDRPCLGSVPDSATRPAYRPSRWRMSWSCVPSSSTRPSPTNAILSALRIVDRRWAITSVVRFCLASSSSRAACTTRSDSVSRADVASSRMRMTGFLMMARAMATRCFWPPESWLPACPTRVE
mmetsp:Transcript_23658/g.64174  ORF Transcript_23658/g.64174 Transcript_23658/m.64174 type:complete len:239 (-) Transcript_23658:1884-2600(-)